MAKPILPHSWFPAPQNLGHQLSVGRKTPTPHLAGPWGPPRHWPSSRGGLPQAPGARHPPTTTPTPRTDIFPPAPFACSRLCPGSLPVPSSSQHARLGAAVPPPRISLLHHCWPCSLSDSITVHLLLPPAAAVIAQSQSHQRLGLGPGSPMLPQDAPLPSLGGSLGGSVSPNSSFSLLE